MRKICTSKHFHTFVHISLWEQFRTFYQELSRSVLCVWSGIPLQVLRYTSLLEHYYTPVLEHCDIPL